jgi:hypothetical protein
LDEFFKPPKLFVKKDGLLDARKADEFYRANYVIALAGEASSDTLEPDSRAKYRQAMNLLLEYEPPFDSEKAVKTLSEWTRLLRIPNDHLAHHFAESINLSSWTPGDGFGNEPKDWKAVAFDALVFSLHLRNLDRPRTNRVTEEVRSLLLQQVERTDPVWNILNDSRMNHTEVQEETEVLPPAHVPGMSKREYLETVKHYMRACDLIAQHHNQVVIGQDRQLLKRDMTWLAWKVIEGLSFQGIADRDLSQNDSAFSQNANRSSVYAVLFGNNRKPGVAVLAGVQLDRVH